MVVGGRRIGDGVVGEASLTGKSHETALEGISPSNRPSATKKPRKYLMDSLLFCSILPRHT